MLVGMEELPTQPPQTFAKRATKLLEQFVEEQKPHVHAAAKRIDAAVARALAAVNELLRRLQKK
jgi:hypothetical protein